MIDRAQTVAPTVRWAAQLSFAGMLLIPLIDVLILVVEPRSPWRTFSGLVSVGGWVLIGILLRTSLLRREPQAYWTFMVFWLPMCVLGGGVALALGAKYGFPSLGYWWLDAALGCAIVLQLSAAVLLALPRSRPVVKIQSGM